MLFKFIIKCFSNDKLVMIKEVGKGLLALDGRGGLDAIDTSWQNHDYLRLIFKIPLTKSKGTSNRKP